MKKSFWIAIVLCTLTRFSEAVGIAMRFVDVTLENVELGTTFNLRVLKNLPLILVNLDPDQGADVVVVSEIPREKEMKDGYEPIADPSWITIVPSQFHLGPKASASADLIVKIPNDPKLIGHHYEAIIAARTDQRNKVLPEGGVLIQTGVRTRFRMSIGTPGPASLQREKLLKKLATVNTNFSINPDNLFVQDVSVGKSIDLKAEKKASLKIINQADDSVSLKFQSIAPDPNITPQSGYGYAPDPHWLEPYSPVITAAGNSIKEIKFRLNIPDKPEYRGKKFMFLVQATLADDSLPLAYNNMIYVSTLP
jgi:hypothetical protein